jgi:hypothetical protein
LLLLNTTSNIEHSTSNIEFFEQRGEFNRGWTQMTADLMFGGGFYHEKHEMHEREEGG